MAKVGSKAKKPMNGRRQAVAPREIRFYRANEKPYGAFSNLFRRPIVFEGRVFPSAEHAYQAGKARKDEVREWILSAPTPALVAMAGHGLYTWEVVPDWSQLKYNRMRRVLHAKFTQHPDLRQLLLSTGSARIVEAGRTVNVVNCTWGEVNGKGENMLGMLLMELRSRLSGRGSNLSSNNNGHKGRKRQLQPQAGNADSKPKGAAGARGA